MSSRITSNMLASNYLNNMQTNLTNMKTLQNQLASGKRMQKASDNPYEASRSMQLNQEISANKQYNENIKDTSNCLDITDTAYRNRKCFGKNRDFAFKRWKWDLFR